MSPYDLHDHAGLRWVVPFAAVFIITLFMALMMLLYPHLLLGA